MHAQTATTPLTNGPTHLPSEAATFVPSGVGWLSQWAESLLVDRGNGLTTLLGDLGPGVAPIESIDFLRGLPAHWQEITNVDYFSEVYEHARIVHDRGACFLPGVTINYHEFVSVLTYATDAGFVPAKIAHYITRMLRWGCDLGAAFSKLKGVRSFRNYGTATGPFQQQVAEALESRIEDLKSLSLLEWLGAESADLVRKVFGDYFIAPLGAREKPLEPLVARPVTDHTRTGFNAACQQGILSHNLDAYEVISRELKPGFLMAVSDVAHAFPLMGLTPYLWPFLMSRFWRVAATVGGKVVLTKMLHLIMPVTGDFGTSGMPGSFHLLYEKGVLQMARSLRIITRPIPTWVDDSGLIGPSGALVRREMSHLQQWASTVLGVFFKKLKDKAPAQVQHMIGFWWSSVDRTCTLDETRLGKYMKELLQFSIRGSLSLSERQVVAGRMQNAIRTMPPGAGCLLANTYAMMHDLTLPWQRRRTSARERSDYRFFSDVLALNLGRGFFSFDQFEEGPTVLSDASKSGGEKGYCGGGWCSSDGEYDYFKYGSKSRRRPIDYLEGDTVVAAVGTMMCAWRGKWIPFGIDNSAFELSAVKGRSRAERLNLLCKRLFVQQIQGNFVLRYFWLSTHDNYLADHLSRGRVHDFLALVAAAGFLAAGVAVLRHPRDGGRTRTFDALDPHAMFALSVAVLTSDPRPPDMGEYSRQVKAVVSLQAVARGCSVRRALARDKARLALAYPGVDTSGTSFVPVATSKPIPGGMRVRRHVTAYGSVRFFIYLFGCCCPTVEATPSAALSEYASFDGLGCCSTLEYLFLVLVTMAVATVLYESIYRRCEAIYRRTDAFDAPGSAESDESSDAKEVPVAPSDDEDAPEFAESSESSDAEEVPVESSDDESKYGMRRGVRVVDYSGEPVPYAQRENGEQWYSFHSSRQTDYSEVLENDANGKDNVPDAAHAPRADGRVPPRGFKWKGPMFQGPSLSNWHVTLPHSHDGSDSFDDAVPGMSAPPANRGPILRHRTSPPPRRPEPGHGGGGRGGGVASAVRRAPIFLLCFGMADVTEGVGGRGISRIDASVQYARATLYSGMRSDYVSRLDQLLDNRLAASSMRTVHRAVELWKEVAAECGWEYVIETDDPERGAKCSTFGIYLMDHYVDLTYDSISNYMWGMRWWMKMNRQQDPVLGVMNWGEFMQALKVVTWVPHEPRRELPFAVIQLMLEAVDLNCFWEVQFALFALILLFTFSRSECPCPKHHTGESSFDERQHWQVRDVVIRMTSRGYALAARFKATKTDPRIERETARGSGDNSGGGAGQGGNDWAYVGDVPGVFSVFTWYRRFMSFFPGPRDATAPFFMAKDRQRAYTYTAAMADLKVLLARVSADVEYGLHSFRVAGYNLSLKGNGEALTVAHGGWESAAHHRYARFQFVNVLGIAANMVGGENVYAAAAEPRDVQRGALARGDAAANPNPPAPPVHNPHLDGSDSEDGLGVPETTRVTRGQAPGPPQVMATAVGAVVPPPAFPIAVGAVVPPPASRRRGHRGRGSTSSA